MLRQSDPYPAIVIVEDEPDILIILRSLVRELTSGYDIVTVNNGRDALAEMARREVPLVMTDYNMPGMNGLELTAKIRSQYPETKVIMITAYSTADLSKRAYAQGVASILEKPFTLDDLTEAIRHALIGEQQT